MWPASNLDIITFTDLAGTRLTGVQAFLLFQVENHGVDHEGSEHEEDASQHPDLDGGETLGLGRVGVDVVEDVDENEEEGDEESHAARYDVRRNQEGYP